MKTLFVTLLMLTAAPALAQTVEAPKAGATLIDSTGKKIGRIDRVLPDGSLRLIANDRFVTVPAATVSMKDGVATTSLSKREVGRL